jgi:hypothetical protein
LTSAPSPYNMDAVMKLGRSRTYYSTNINVTGGSTVVTHRGTQHAQGLTQGLGTPTTLTGTTKLPSDVC